MAHSQVKTPERKECSGIMKRDWRSTAAHGQRPGPDCHLASAGLPAAQRPRLHGGTSHAVEAFRILRISARQSQSSVRLAGKHEGGHPPVLFLCTAEFSTQAFQERTLSESICKPCSTWVMGIKNPLITSVDDPVNENVVDGRLDNYSLG